MKKWVTEPARKLPITGAYDVVVVGGGIAGVAAAVAAARNGATVALVEKANALGGLATLGNVVMYLPLCDGRGHQVIRGLGEELLLLSVQDGEYRIPSCWEPGGDPDERTRSRYRVYFNPASFMLALEALLIDEGVTLYYDTRFCDVRKRGDGIETVIVESKDGRTALRAGAVVDASGDADVCACAGEETVSLSTNTRSAWFFYRDGADVKLNALHVPFDPAGLIVPGRERGYSGDCARDVTQHLIDSRALIREDLAARAAASEHGVYPLVLPTLATFRMTRRLKGRVELGKEHERECFPDSVGMTGDWRESGPIYYLPFQALIGTRTANLVAAGRCISAGSAWDITRAIPTCAVTGEAAGTAAALLTQQGGGHFADLDIAALHGRLRRQKVPIRKRIARSEP